MRILSNQKLTIFALAGYRRAIANFVNIVTNRSDIKVRYQQNGDSYTDGNRNDWF